MSELFWNKVAGTALTTLMVAFGLNELTHVLYHPHAPEELAYVIDIPDGPGGAVVEPEEMGPPDWGLVIPAADVAAGENQAKKCLACHSFENGGGHGLGPNLWNIIDRPAASADGFGGYSAAMQDYGQLWGYQNLYDYLERPQGYIAGTAMAFAGLRKQEDRINLIAYLREQADSPAALPEPLPVVEEVLEEVTEAVDGETDAVIEAIQEAVEETTDAG